MNTVFGRKVLPQGSPAIPLLGKNDPRGIYISHIDRTPLRIKIWTFVTILLTCLACSILVVWRVSKICKIFLAFFLIDLSYVDGDSKGFWSWCWMYMFALFDFYLLTAVLPSLRTMITGYLWFRLRFGFREVEVIFRAPTGREYNNMLRLPPAEFQRVWQTSVLRATAPEIVLGKTGWNTRCPPWELCYAASMDAHRLAKRGVFDLQNWELSVWQKDEYKRWTVCEVWKHQDPSLCAMAIDIIKERVLAHETLAANLEAVLAQQASGVSAPLSNPATQVELLQSINTLFTANGFDLDGMWVEAMAEADRIRRQPQQPQ